MVSHLYKTFRYQIMGYTANAFLISIVNVKRLFLAAMKFLSKLDFSMHSGKSKLIPTQISEFLEYVINSKQMTVYQKESPSRCFKWLPHLWSVRQV